MLSAPDNRLKKMQNKLDGWYQIHNHNQGTEDTRNISERVDFDQNPVLSLFFRNLNWKRIIKGKKLGKDEAL